MTTYGSLDRTSRTARLTPRLTRILRRPSKLSIIDIADRPPRDGGVLGDDISPASPLPLPINTADPCSHSLLQCDVINTSEKEKTKIEFKTERKVRNTTAPCGCGNVISYLIRSNRPRGASLGGAPPGLASWDFLIPSFSWKMFSGHGKCSRSLTRRREILERK